MAKESRFQGGDRVVLKETSDWPETERGRSYMLGERGVVQSAGLNSYDYHQRRRLLVSWNGDLPIWTPIEVIELAPLTDDDMETVYKSLGVER